MKNEMSEVVYAFVNRLAQPQDNKIRCQFVFLADLVPSKHTSIKLCFYFIKKVSNRFTAGSYIPNFNPVFTAKYSGI